jgi:hypothetical protein
MLGSSCLSVIALRNGIKRKKFVPILCHYKIECNLRTLIFWRRVNPCHKNFLYVGGIIFKYILITRMNYRHCVVTPV